MPRKTEEYSGGHQEQYAEQYRQEKMEAAATIFQEQVKGTENYDFDRLTEATRHGLELIAEDRPETAKMLLEKTGFWDSATAATTILAYEGNGDSLSRHGSPVTSLSDIRETVGIIMTSSPEVAQENRDLIEDYTRAMRFFHREGENEGAAKFARELKTLSWDLNPQDTVLIGQDAVIESYRQEMPFLKEHAHHQGRATQEDVAGLNVVGAIPIHLAAAAESVTTLQFRTVSLDDRIDRDAAGHYGPEQTQVQEKHVLQWRAERLEEPERLLQDHPEDVIIVSRHPEMKEELVARGLADESVPALQHVDSPAQVEGKIVLGTLPPHLATEARAVGVMEYDPQTGGYGELVMYRAEKLREIAIPNAQNE